MLLSPPAPPEFFSPIDEAIESVRAGQMVVICDAEARKNECHLMCAAEAATADSVNFMAREGRGLICLALTAERCDALRLRPMASHGSSSVQKAFTVSIEARVGVRTGISTADRAHTIRVAIDSASSFADIVHPGHMFPLKARPGGVLERPGHTEAAVDLARLAGLNPAGVTCEILDEHGDVARARDLADYCARRSLKLVSIEDLTRFRIAREKLVERVVSTALPTAFGDFEAIGYRSLVAGEQDHLALVKGTVEGCEDVLVRVHDGCLAGEALRSLQCTCGEKLQTALKLIAREGAGILLYLAAPDRRVGGAPSPSGMPRDRVSAQIISDIGVQTVRLLTTSTGHPPGIEACGIKVTAQVPLASVGHASARSSR